MTADSPIDVLLVDDSPLAIAVLTKILSSSALVRMVGAAKSGKEALGMLERIKPDVICTDLNMPEMNGIQFVEKLMQTTPCPVLVMSSTVSSDPQKIFQIIESGALDFVAKPSHDSDFEARQFIQKIVLISKVAVCKRHPLKKREGKTGQKPPLSVPAPKGVPVIKMVAIGASTGGPQALEIVLKKLPEDFPVPILCVQHITLGFLPGMIEWLSSRCKLKIKIAQSGEFPRPATVYFPEEKTHLEVSPEGRLVSSFKPPIGGHRPSITLTFQTMADCYKHRSMGILLTGMGRDGAEGMKHIADSGGITIAQDEKTSVVFSMPKEAISLGSVGYVLPIHQIPFTLTELLSMDTKKNTRRRYDR